MQQRVVEHIERETVGAVQAKKLAGPTSVSVTTVTEGEKGGCCSIVLDPVFDAESDGDP